MPMRPENQRTFTRTLYAGWLETVTLLKRGDDMEGSVVTTLLLFDVRPGQIWKTGEPIAGQMTSDHRRTWHIPRRELDRVGVNYINMLDRIVDKEGRHWQPESTTRIGMKLGMVEIDVDCLMTDPPVGPSVIG